MARVVAEEGRMLGGQRELRVEEETGIEARMVHGGSGGGLVVQQRHVGRRVETVRIEVGQQMRRRMKRRT